MIMKQHIRYRIKKCGIKLTKNQIVHSIFLRRIFYFPVSQAWLIQSSPAQSIISKANLSKHNGIKTMTSYYINQDLITELHWDRLCNTFGSHVHMNMRKYQHSFKNGNKIQLCKFKTLDSIPGKDSKFPVFTIVFSSSFSITMDARLFFSFTGCASKNGKK